MGSWPSRCSCARSASPCSRVRVLALSPLQTRSPTAAASGCALRRRLSLCGGLNLGLRRSTGSVETRSPSWNVGG